MKRTHTQAGFNTTDFTTKRPHPSLFREGVKPRLSTVKDPAVRPTVVGSTKNVTQVNKNSIPKKSFKPQLPLNNTSSIKPTSSRTNMPNSQEPSASSWASKVLSRPHLSKKIPLLKSPIQAKNNSPVSFPTRRALEPSPRKIKQSYQLDSPIVERGIKPIPNLQVEKMKPKTFGTPTRSFTKPLPYLGDFTLTPALELAKTFGFTFDESSNQDKSELNQETTVDDYQPDQPRNLQFQLQQLKLQRDSLLDQQRVSDFLFTKNLGARNELLAELNTLIDVTLVNSDRVLGTLRQPLIHHKALRIEPSFQRKFSDLFKSIDSILMNPEMMDIPYGFKGFQIQREEKIGSLFDSISQLSATLSSLSDTMSQFSLVSSTLFSGGSNV